ncbi:hypothetical protein [Microtetraspora malaysiensis]|uniref:hypothetical protein n=1 Tax=Microtetraspora malaysiensis TaxID=161358 RepID=UPI000A5C46C5|nr:hypothetical protein [Microtetraspora malaysiensis]
MQKANTPTLAGYVVTAVLAGLLTGCGMLTAQQGGGEKQPVAKEKQAVELANSADSAEPASTGDGGDSETGGQAGAPAEQGTVIAGREVKAGGADLTVEITGLKRQGRLSTLTFTVTNKGDTRWEMSSNMGDTPAGLGLTVAGISLVDPVNGKRYTVARTGTPPTKAKCLCSDYDVWTEPGEVLPLHATFAAPPPDVTKINVDLKVLGVFTDVPIS